MCDGPLISYEDLPFAVNRTDQGTFKEQDLKNATFQFKKQLVIQTLESVQGNRTKAAKILKIQRTYLSRLITDLEIVGI